MILAQSFTRAYVLSPYATRNGLAEFGQNVQLRGRANSGATPLLLICLCVGLFAKSIILGHA